MPTVVVTSTLCHAVCNTTQVHSLPWSPLQEDNAQAEVQLQVRFQEPAKAVTPQQAFVMYDCDVCLGSALVQHPGPSLYECGTEKQPNAA